MRIRWMIRQDLPEVMDIMRRSYVEPWSEDEVLACMQCKTTIGHVVESDDRVIGFTLFDLGKKAISIVLLAVHPEERRLGVGRLMVERVVGKLAVGRRTAVNLLACEKDLCAHLFLKACGFRVVKTFAGMYDNDADGYLFSREYKEPAAKEESNATTH